MVFDLLRPYGDFPYLVSAATYDAVILKADYAGDWASNAVGPARSGWSPTPPPRERGSSATPRTGIAIGASWTVSV